MTTVAGFDFHRELSRVASSAGFPTVVLAQVGQEHIGRGIVDGTTATYLPPTTDIVPRIGDRIRYGARQWNIEAVEGLEDAWTLTLTAEESPQLGDNTGFAAGLELQPIPGYGFVLVRTDGGSAVIEGRYRINRGGWNTFASETRVARVQVGPGELEVDVWRASSDGDGDEPIHLTATLT